MPILVFLLFAVAALTASSSRAQGFPPAPVIVAEVIERPAAAELTLVGTVLPRRTSMVASRAEGRVTKRYKEAGAIIANNESLFRLSNAQTKAALIDALGDLKLQKFTYAQDSELFAQEAIPEQQLRQSEYEMVRAQAKLEALEAQMNNMSIRAPFTGHIVETFTELGQWVNRGDPVARIISTDTVRVHVEVPDRYITRLALGDKAAIEVDALGGVPLTARIVAILAEGSAESHTFPVLLEIINTDGRIRSHMAARVQLSSAASTPQLLVHKDALINGPQGTIAYVVEADKAVAKPLKAGLAYEGFVAVEGELQPGDLTVVRGNERLRPGQDVRIIRKQE